jgi:hypothetical protein
MTGLARDPETGELYGPPHVLEAAIAAGDEPVFALVREPAFRVWVEGLALGLTLLGGSDACALITQRPDGQRALAALDPELAAVALVAWLGLGPRPRPDGPPIQLEPGPMAQLIGRDERFERARHWSVRFEAGGWRRNVEVVEGEAGIWRVRPGDDGLVELFPTTTTDVVRELVALLRAPRPYPAAPLWQIVWGSKVFS